MNIVQFRIILIKFCCFSFTIEVLYYLQPAGNNCGKTLKYFHTIYPIPRN